MPCKVSVGSSCMLAVQRTVESLVTRGKQVDGKQANSSIY